MGACDGLPGGLAHPGALLASSAAGVGTGAEFLQRELNSEAAHGASEEVEDDAGAASAVSRLQELMQSCCSSSAHKRILTWGFEQQLKPDTSLQFCATVSFIFGSIPHSFCGGWQSSKKTAQRDTAERVQRYLRGRLQGTPPGRDMTRAALDPQCLREEIVQELSEVCAFGGAGAADGRSLLWRVEDRGLGAAAEAGQPLHRFRAMLTFYALSMPHSFVGSWCAGELAAKRDAAERVLWYYGRSSEVFANAGAPGEGQKDAPVNTLATPPASTATEQEVEDRTVLMRVQNALQKAFAKDTPPGKQVWVWSYEQDSGDPQVFRARVDVPCWQRFFHGGWCRGKKLAQRSACLEVKRHLDEWLGFSQRDVLLV